MVHHLFVGWFERMGDMVRFEPLRPRGIEVSKPVVTRRIDAEMIDKLVDEIRRSYSQTITGKPPVPTTDGFVIFDRYGLDKSDLELIRMLHDGMGCDIYDASFAQFLRVDELNVAR
jgi:hypothetical protein